MSNDVALEAPSVNKKSKKKRPDGLEVDRYKNLEKWSYRHWAWEFLRRNSKFIAECKKLDSSANEEKQKVAEEFGLKKFKKYTESYRGESGYPRFSIGSITSWTNLDKNEGNDRHVKVKIGASQMLIRFDLASIIEDKTALEKQLRLAENRLNRRIAVYEKELKKEAKPSAHKVSVFGKYIRLLDHLAAGMSRVECAQLIYPEESKAFQEGNRKRFEMNNLVKNQLKKAHEYANIRYEYLSLIKGSPMIKSIPLTATTSRADE